MSSAKWFFAKCECFLSVFFHFSKRPRIKNFPNNLSIQTCVEYQVSIRYIWFLSYQKYLCWLIYCENSKLSIFHLIEFFQGRMLKDNKKNDISLNNHALVLRNISKFQNGNYSCVASNEEGDGESNFFNLRIMCKCKYSLNFIAKFLW